MNVASLRTMALRLSVAAVVAIVFAAPRNASGQDEFFFMAKNEPTDSLDDQIRIMSRVLEKSLDRRGPEDWKRRFVGMSFFDSHVTGEYVPTVGVIYTLRTRVPLRPTKEEPGTKDRPNREVDLWEETAEREQPFEALADAPTGPEPVPEPVREPVIIQGDLAPSELNARIEQEIGRLKRTIEEVTVIDRDHALFFESGRDYDAADVESLKRTVIGTVARYGHRMTALPDDERILIVIEGPNLSPNFAFTGPRAPRAVRIERDGRGDVDAKVDVHTEEHGVPSDATFHGTEEPTPKPAPERRERGEREHAERERSKAPRQDGVHVRVDAIRKAGAPNDRMHRFRDERDRILISIAAGDLTGELNYDGLAELVKTIEY